MDLDQRTIDLAVQFGTLAEREDGYTAIMACCWMLADLIVQAEVFNGRPADQSIVLVLRQVVMNVERLRAQAREVQH